MFYNVKALLSAQPGEGLLFVRIVIQLLINIG